MTYQRATHPGDRAIRAPGGRSLLAAARTIRKGGLVAYPTEAVFGLGCDPRNTNALRRILRLKQRDASKGLILIASSFCQLRPYITAVPEDVLARVRTTWPGPVTWLMPARPWVSQLLRGRHESVAVRVTAHPVAAALCRAAGMAIVSTSANISGGVPARTSGQATARFGARVDYVLSGSVDRTASPTRICDLQTGRVLRPAESGEQPMSGSASFG
ncbi:MAG: L-threonylcarbamoyladenylate synthase [Pseudomonadota bacterium]|nr:L-threonylcarbamoyladenylate synthase [Pseudomonadota bacterium]